MRFLFILSLLIFHKGLIGQNQLSKSKMKGHWIVQNNDSMLFTADTVFFVKMTNRDKSIPTHHFQRPFLEFRQEISGEDFFYFEFRSSSIRISNIVGDTQHMYHDGEWFIKGKILIIKNNEIQLKYRLIKTTSKLYTFDGEEYSTPMIFFKRL